MKRLLSLLLVLMMLIPTLLYDVPQVSATTDETVSNVENVENAENAEPVSDAEAVETTTEADVADDLSGKEDKPINSDPKGKESTVNGVRFYGDSSINYENAKLSNLVPTKDLKTGAENDPHSSWLSNTVVPLSYAYIGTVEQIKEAYWDRPDNEINDNSYGNIDAYYYYSRREGNGWSIVTTPNPPNGDYSAVTGKGLANSDGRGNYGVSVSNLATGFKIPGYTFSHWLTDNSLDPSVPPVVLYPSDKFSIGGSAGDQDRPGGFIEKIPHSQIAFFNKTSNCGVHAIVLHAQWEPIKYYVEFNANGSAEATECFGPFNYGEEYSFEEYNDKYTKYGYKLLGWSTTPDGSSGLMGDTFENLTVYNGNVITLYAQWQKMNNTYGIWFNGNGAEGGTMSSLDKIYGYSDPIKLPKNNFYRTGYTFAGWCRKANGADKIYPDEATVKSIYEENGFCTLYAQWEPISYIIMYYENGGTFATNTRKIVYTHYDQVITLLSNDDISRSGYIFGGWNTRANGKGTQYIAGFQGMNLAGWESGYINLYAQWLKRGVKYTIVYDKNAADATGTVNNQTVDTGEHTTIRTNGYTRTGYNFSCWNTKKDGTGTDYSQRATLAPSQHLTTVDGKYVRLYAQWEPVTMQIYFMQNQPFPMPGGATMDNTVMSATGTFGQPYPTAMSPGSEKTGYIFAGWYLNSECTGKQVTPSTTIQTPGDHRVYARWVEETTTIKWAVIYTNGGKWSNGTETAAWYQGTYGDTIEVELPTKVGHRITGWTYYARGTQTQVKPSVNYHRISGNQVSFSTNDADLYPTWTANEYTIKYNANGATTDAATPDNQTVTYGNQYAYAPLPNSIFFEKKNYHLAGWNEYADGSGEHYDAATGRVGFMDVAHGSTVNLYAEWEIDTYTIEFDPARDRNYEGEMEPMVCEHGKTYSLNMNTFRDVDYIKVFDYWLDEATGNTYTDGQEITNLAQHGQTVTLKAVWRPLRHYIILDGNGGTRTENGEVVEFVTHTNDVAYSTYFLPDYDFFTRPGYIIYGYYDVTNDKYYNYGDELDDRNMESADGYTFVIKALWTTTYTIKFDVTGIDHGQTPADIECTYDNRYRLPYAEYDQLERWGYTFVGWNTDPGYDGDFYDEGEYVSELTSEPGGVVTLYAQWDIIPFDIYLNPSYSGGPSSKRVTIASDYHTLSSTEFARYGYKISGWYCDETEEYFGPNGTISDLVYTNIVYDGVNLNAQWSPIVYTIEYHPNGGTGDIYTQNVEYDGHENLMPNQFEPPEGKVFDCWLIKASGFSGETYSDEEQDIDNLTGIEGEVVVLEAQWIDAAYVVLDANNNTGERYTIAFKAGLAFTFPENMFTAPTGYEFDCWKYSRTNEECLPGTTWARLFANPGTYVFTAQWRSLENTLLVNPAGGTWRGSTQVTTLVQAAYTDARIELPTREGYQFAGWDFEGDGAFDGAITDDPTFANSKGGVSAFYTKDQTHISVERINVTESTGDPTGSGYVLEISKTGSSNCGFLQKCVPQPNKTYIHLFKAKLNKSVSLVASTSGLNGATTTWLTPKQGTGDWATYAYKVVIPSSLGTNPYFGCIYTSGDTAPFIWHLASSQIYTVSDTTVTFPKGSGTLTANWILTQYKVNLIDNTGDTLSYMDTATGTLKPIKTQFTLPVLDSKGAKAVYYLKDLVYKDDNNTSCYPEKQDHIFTGWYKSRLGAQYSSPGDAYGKNAVLESAVTDLYAGFIEIGNTLEIKEEYNDPGYQNFAPGGTDPNKNCSEFQMFGVQVRTADKVTGGSLSNNGLRFMIRISKNLVSELDALHPDKDSAVYGFITGQKKVLDAYNQAASGRNVMLSHNQVVTAAGDKYAKKQSQRDLLQTPEYNVYTCVITGYDHNQLSTDVFKSRMETAFAVRPYIEYVDANGVLRTYYQTDELAYHTDVNERNKTIGGAYHASLHKISNYIFNKEGVSDKIKERIYEYYLQPYYYEDAKDLTWQEFASQKDSIINK